MSKQPEIPLGFLSRLAFAMLRLSFYNKQKSWTKPLNF
jgi:hypothetical protein